MPPCGHTNANGTAQPVSSPRRVPPHTRRHVLADGGLEDELGILLADLPVDLAGDRDLVPLADVERAEDRLVLDELGRIVVGLLALLLLGLVEGVRDGGRRGDLAVGARHDLAALEVRDLLAVRRLLARLDVVAAHPAVRLDLDPGLLAALAAGGLRPARRACRRRSCRSACRRRRDRGGRRRCGRARASGSTRGSPAGRPRSVSAWVPAPGSVPGWAAWLPLQATSGHHRAAPDAHAQAIPRSARNSRQHGRP